MTTNYLGQRIGHLTVVERAGSLRSPTNGRTRALWRARCDCGKEIVRQSAVLWRGGDNASCGCAQRELAAKRRFKHGLTDTRTHISWMAMMRRCENPDADNFKHYGARGISVCERWRDFANFLADMGERPPGKSLDRIDVNGNYEPANCRWATQKEQCNNKRDSIHHEAFGLSKTLREWSDLVGLSPPTLDARINRHGWDVVRALTTPSRLAPKPNPNKEQHDAR